MDIEEIVEEMKESILLHCYQVLLFCKEDQVKFENVIERLKKGNINILDVNEYVKIKEEDYDLASGYGDGNINYTIRELRALAIHPERINDQFVENIKLKNIHSVIDNNTILVVRYNETIKNDHILYEMIRSLLKDGLFGVCGCNYELQNIRAIVINETNEPIRDFLPYGFRV